MAKQIRIDNDQGTSASQGCVCVCSLIETASERDSLVRRQKIDSQAKHVRRGPYAYTKAKKPIFVRMCVSICMAKVVRHVQQRTGTSSLRV